MRLVRGNRDRPAAAVAVATAAVDTVVVAKAAAASEEATRTPGKGSKGELGRAGFEPAKA
jgi:hypothetical protein